jgi:CRISPR/Cas system CMR-associated protein Cmr5 small subunit
MKRINQRIPLAMTALRNSGLIETDGVSIQKEYDGYVASFAPSVITAGLRATLSFYTDHHKTPERRVKVLRIIHAIYTAAGGSLAGDDLLTIALTNRDANVERQLRNDLIDCATALKLVMRNFKQLGDEEE